MRTARVLWWLTIGCAALLVIAPFTPRTTWLAKNRAAGLSSITEGVGWQAIAALIGIAVTGVLIAGVSARQRESAVTAAALATFGFVVTAVGMTRHWIDLMNGVTSVSAGPNFELHPAPFIPVFAGLAAVGAVCAFTLTILSLRSVTAGPDLAPD